MRPEAAGLIAVDPDVLHGRAHIWGTCIPMSAVLDAIAAGMSEAEILQEYPTLTPEGIRAGAAYGAELACEEVLALADGLCSGR
ncbi:MAG: DUF433 domain-containing protein [Gaiellaceae bacterium]